MKFFQKFKLSFLSFLILNKNKAELEFWKSELKRYIKWYQGLEKLYGFPFPRQDEKISGYGLHADAAMTWSKLFQEKKYIVDLQLDVNAFCGLRVLDVGCGPFPNLLVFSNCKRHGLDPLIDLYKSAGYPIEIWSKRGYTYHCADAESMPFPDGYFDAVISVNAIDHVDNFTAVAQEIRRVLKRGGKFRMHVHYHKKTKTEPIELNDKIFIQHYNWVSGLQKIYEGNKKDMELHTAPQGELFVVWGNS